MLPRLKVLTLDGVHVAWHALGNVLSESLEFLTLMNHCPDVCPSSTQFQAILKATPSLKKLHIENTIIRTEDQPGLLNPVLLPELRELILGSFYTLHIAVVLYLLEAPNITSFTMSNTTDEIISDPDDDLGHLSDNEVLDILSRYESETSLYPGTYHRRPRFKHLERLILDRMTLSRDTLKEFLSLLPRLRLVGVWEYRTGSTTCQSLLNCIPNPEELDVEATALYYREHKRRWEWIDFRGGSSLEWRTFVEALGCTSFYSKSQRKLGAFSAVYFDMPAGTLSRCRPTKKRRLGFTHPSWAFV
ncbi:hypothetical protein BDN70DRAFT_935459 [Pholiota conissans]|uniref:Uncharacterized protein n=1 Tax=Pholiota conissans TaxID=109636 RepID=A0A9P5YUE8_9AGAR|nr:hypothetical protein BDN70DRAFT_935459 [Pholiota conissans]